MPMVNTQTDLIFHPRLIPEIASQRGKQWSDFVRRVAKTDEVSIDKIAFVLMMSRLAGCTTCSSNSHRALNGCELCARLAIKRYKGSDADLIENYEAALQEVRKHIKSLHGRGT